MRDSSVPTQPRARLLPPHRATGPRHRAPALAAQDDALADAEVLLPPDAGIATPPAPPRGWVVVPFVLGAGAALMVLWAWGTPHSLPVRLGVVFAASALLAVGVGRQAAALTGLHGTALSNAALTRAMQHLTTMNEHLQLLATTDPLTGLPNRALLPDYLAQALLPGPHGDARLALLLLDLDRFKEVNDTLGHHAGDLLLQQIALRLRETLGTSGDIIRLGGDEFAVLQPALGAVGAEALAARCLSALETPFLLDDHTLHIGGSIGIALAPDHGSEASMLLRCADVAMYVAKTQQKGYALYRPADDQHSLQRLGLAGELQHAILRGELCLYYQPKVQLATGRACGVEALVRWRHPTHGLIPPDQFIPLAEQTGLVVPLLQWALTTALHQCQEWHAAGLVLPVAVNLSMRNLQDPQLPAMVSTLLHQSAVAPDLLTLEITESMLMADPAATLDILTRLDALGIKLAIDDFGTGHSSLSKLKRLPVDELKIDRAFVFDLDAQRRSGVLNKDRMIVRSVTALAHALGLAVVAEGVENQLTYELLGALRCDIAQGNYLSPPLPAGMVEGWARSTEFSRPLAMMVAGVAAAPQ